MNIKNKVGAGILNAITESLYDNPIVVFREYVQNSVDAFKHPNSNSNSRVKIIYHTDSNTSSLCFLDNGSGITENKFLEKMTSIGASFKIQTEDVGYKGIGRLSGISYCDALYFLNILDFHENSFQIYKIDCNAYRSLKKNSNLSEMDFATLMDSIGSVLQSKEERDAFIQSIDLNLLLSQNQDMYNNSNSGFLVIMENLSPLLTDVIGEKDFMNNLGWLLPVDFEHEIFSNDRCKDAIDYISKTIPDSLRSYDITFNNQPILRPIKKDDLRSYSIVKNLDYGFMFLNFNNDRMIIDKKNIFSGIKVYLDNFLLCDENELIPSLARYRFLKSSSTNEMIQSCRTIGGIIYISSKSLIFANARRTFVEVYDSDSLNFLNNVGSCIAGINETRYSLSRLHSEIKKVDKNQTRVDMLLQRANEHLAALTNFDCPIDDAFLKSEQNFEDLSPDEQKKLLKKKISTVIDKYISEFIEQYSVSDYQTASDDFFLWLKNKV